MRSLGDQTEDGGHDYTCFALPYWYVIYCIVGDCV